MQVAVLGIDLGKNSCSVVGLNGKGEVVLRRRMRRDTLVTLTSALPPCIVAMEACYGAHHLGRLLAAHGHSIRLMSPESQVGITKVEISFEVAISRFPALD